MGWCFGIPLIVLALPLFIIYALKEANGSMLQFRLAVLLCAVGILFIAAGYFGLI